MKTFWVFDLLIHLELDPRAVFTQLKVPSLLWDRSQENLQIQIIPSLHQSTPIRSLHRQQSPKCYLHHQFRCSLLIPMILPDLLQFLSDLLHLWDQLCFCSIHNQHAHPPRNRSVWQQLL